MGTYMLVVVDFTGVLEILIFSFRSTRSCHFKSYAPTSPSNLFHPAGARIEIPLPLSANFSYVNIGIIYRLKIGNESVCHYDDEMGSSTYIYIYM
jgi:hypothetical protein